MNQAAAQAFERSFLSASIARQIDGCESYELAQLFLDLFSESQPVLEAGCGSGRWCGWLFAQGITADGVDWSQALCDRAAAEMPASRFYACDMSNTGLPSASYGGIMALGSIEHAIAGPHLALAEFYRLLRPGGVAVITVPHGSWLRILSRKIRLPFEMLKGHALLRRILGKPPLNPGAPTFENARIGTVPAWHPQFAIGQDGWSFYEYQFNPRQMDRFLTKAGFRIKLRFTEFPEEGIYHTFGRLAGCWNQDSARVELNMIGKLLRAFLPSSSTGHMLCYVVERPNFA